ncbi:MAG: GTP cyclohydrolase I FolE2 [Bdellovibrionales bacterium]|nr:GTP cyclohydrolase I FolE2 [Bdellovibrionales bacterium]
MLNKNLKDVSKSTSPYKTTLPAVGMEEVQLLINGQSGLAKIFINFKDQTSRGIHMSRLYKLLRDYFSSSDTQAEQNKTLSFDNLQNFLKEILKSHQSQADKAYLILDFPFFVKRESLVSKQWGIRNYPLKIKASLNEKNEFNVYINFTLTYSSTCPCSASLAQDLNKEAFFKQFKDQKNISATDIDTWFSDLNNVAAFPHAQRSSADITLLVDQKLILNQVTELINLEINKSEKMLKTSVQAFVKREDEQEFAHLNAKSPLFCEDAARKLKLLYNKEEYVKDFLIKVSHEESLHPHNAVSFAFKPEGEFSKSGPLFFM